MNNLTIRQATISDIPELIKIDNAAFSKPWSNVMFSDELEKDYSFYFIAESNGIPVGYAGIWCIYETAELIRIATHPDYRKHGIAHLLMKTILNEASVHNCENMMLEVRHSNIAAQGLYEKNNFNCISIRKGYYDGEDALIMQTIL